MTYYTLALTLTLLLTAEPVLAAQREIIGADWTTFQQQVSTRKLSKRPVRITLSGGGEIKTTLVSVDDTGLLVKAAKGTKQWESGPERARIPTDQIRSIRFEGRIGHRGLILGLTGLSVGVAVPLGMSASRGEDVPTGLAAIVLGPALGAAGYLVGHVMDKPAPEFVIR